MQNVKTKYGLIIIVGLCIASFLGALNFKPIETSSQINDNNEQLETKREITEKNVELKSSGAVPANFEWYRTYGTGWGDCNGRAVALDSKGNVYLGGHTDWGYYDSNDMQLLKFNSTGHILLDISWSYDIYGYKADFCQDIAIDLCDNVILAGFTFSKGAGEADFCVVKYNSQGVELWNRTWGTAKREIGMAVAVDSLGDIYVCGNENDGYIETNNITVVKFNSTGSLKWSNKWKGSDDDNAFAIGLDSEENVIVGGYTESFGAQARDAILIKLNKTNGNKLWNKTWGSSGYDQINDLIVDSEDNIFVAGSTSSFGSVGWGMLLAKFNKTGDHEWHRLWGEASEEWGNGIAMDSLNNVYLGGYDLFGNIKLVKYDYFGTQLWNESWGTYESCESIVVDSQKNIYCGGYHRPDGGNKDMLLLKYNHSRPDFTINAPTLNQIAGKNAPSYNVDVIEPYLNSSWYTINGSSETHEFTGGVIDTVDQNDWNLLGNGTVMLRFYANNSAGVENSKEIKIKRDIIDPVITINDPIDGDGFYDPPFFNVTVIEPNLKLLEYTIDNDASNWSCYFFGSVWPSLWDAAQYGNVTIRFYAKDKGGNVGIAEVNVTKLAEKIAAVLSDDDDGGGGGGGKKEVIPGFRVVLVIIAIVSTSILLIKKRSNPKLK